MKRNLKEVVFMVMLEVEWWSDGGVVVMMSVKMVVMERKV